jgi:hypothetical protein
MAFAVEHVADLHQSPSAKNCRQRRPHRAAGDAFTLRLLNKRLSKSGNCAVFVQLSRDRKPRDAGAAMLVDFAS